ncbi:hypothetical protein Saso_46060 [Streptomyces asoensis]|uniref:Integral membrane protein n=2 Tax=Streptomyces TaxID=1883 RepID=A0ABQ3S4A5_9ACTN|nr:hypothetical protein GCM10010496_23740 [Streptomyces asoensis]GHI62956.1 hypothetical protein Saso_46060 [Streptomyces asoensis]
MGSTGAPPAMATCVPACPSRVPPTDDMPAGGATDEEADGDAGFDAAADGEPDAVGDPDAAGDGDGLGAASETGAVSARDARVAEVTSRHRLTVCIMGAGTTENVPGTRREVPSPSPPRSRNRTPAGDTEPMKLSRPVSWFLLAFGVWSWIIWVTFVKNLIKDSSGLAFDDGDPTAYFWVHLTLAIVSFLLGTVVGVIGLRGLRALRQAS